MSVVTCVQLMLFIITDIKTLVGKCDTMGVGSSLTRGSRVYVGVDVRSSELVTISDWQLSSAGGHGTKPESHYYQTQVSCIVHVMFLKYIMSELLE